MVINIVQRQCRSGEIIEAIEYRNLHMKFLRKLEKPQRVG